MCKQIYHFQDSVWMAKQDPTMQVQSVTFHVTQTDEKPVTNSKAIKIRHRIRRFTRKLALVELFSAFLTGASIIRSTVHLVSRYHLGIQLGVFTFHMVALAHGWL